jgi:hypothetical protein
MSEGIEDAIRQLDQTIASLTQTGPSAIRVEGKVGNLHLTRVRAVGFSSIISVGPDGSISNAYLTDTEAYAPARAPDVLAELREIRVVLDRMAKGTSRPEEEVSIAGRIRRWGPTLLNALPGVVDVFARVLPK